jgi:aromatic ring-opening dioxygenase LigB subunit
VKRIVVQWDADAYKEFSALQQAVIEGKRARAPPSYDQLLTSVNNAIKNLRTNAFHGNLIPRSYLSKNIIDKYGTDKIFRIELVGYWRLLYTVVGDETQIIALILEYMDHPTYDKLFGYRKR